MSLEYSIYKFPIAYNPKDHIIYYDDPAMDVPPYQYPLMDAKAWAEAVGKKGIGHESAGGVNVSDPLALTDIFFNNNRHGLNMADTANDFLSRLHEAKSIEDRRKARDAAGAIITSTDFADFQTLTTLGENLEVQQIKEGVLKGLFQEIPTPQLGGKWAQLDSDIRWHRNLGEGKSPEPSGGTGTIVEVFVQKHGAAVGITQRAQDLINGDNPYGRLVSMMQRKRIEDENEMVAEEIESNTANTAINGVDFGSRSGTPPVSQTNPYDLITEIIEKFDTLKAPWNLFVSRGKPFVEYSGNDSVRGASNPLPTQTTQDEQVSAFPLAAGVRWARDNKISSTTDGWALNDSAIKEFRGATRSYTVSNPDTETTRTVIKTHFAVQTMDPTLVWIIEDIAA